MFWKPCLSALHEFGGQNIRRQRKKQENERICHGMAESISSNIIIDLYEKRSVA